DHREGRLDVQDAVRTAEPTHKLLFPEPPLVPVMGRETDDVPPGHLALNIPVRPIARFARQRPSLPSHAAALTHDALSLAFLRSGKPYKFAGDEADPSDRHLAATMDWLARAQDATPDDGVSAVYSLASGWAASYPETTGYIIPTCFDFAAHSGDVVF